ncbi:phasin family protein [Chelatococcus sp. GCM10030263]|uniref:phasin family protein n=1 Tax=Chelatococcus sp. GCM10030263 TaxID=3273387 RepID=UPI0036212730
MINPGMPNYEIPAEFRRLAEQNVEQARKAFTGFLDAANKAVEVFGGSTPLPGAGEVTRRTLAYAEQNVTAAFDLAQKLVQARDVNEALKHQSDYLHAQVASLQEQLKDFTAAVDKVREDVTGGSTPTGRNGSGKGPTGPGTGAPGKAV